MSTPDMSSYQYLTYHPQKPDTWTLGSTLNRQQTVLRLQEDKPKELRSSKSEQTS